MTKHVSFQGRYLIPLAMFGSLLSASAEIFSILFSCWQCLSESLIEVKFPVSCPPDVFAEPTHSTPNRSFSLTLVTS